MKNSTKTIITTTAAILLAACSQQVKLDPPIQGQNGGINAGQNPEQAQSHIEPVQIYSGTAGQYDPNNPANQYGQQNNANTIYFEYDSYQISPQYQGIVQNHTRALQQNPQSTIYLQGHTDTRGSREYNLALGQKRAEAVLRAMTITGANPAQIEAISYGEERPQAYGASETDHAQNRRVEITNK